MNMKRVYILPVTETTVFPAEDMMIISVVSGEGGAYILPDHPEVRRRSDARAVF